MSVDEREMLCYWCFPGSSTPLRHAAGLIKGCDEWLALLRQDSTAGGIATPCRMEHGTWHREGYLLSIPQHLNDPAAPAMLAPLVMLPPRVRKSHSLGSQHSLYLLLTPGACEPDTCSGRLISLDPVTKALLILTKV